MQTVLTTNHMESANSDNVSRRAGKSVHTVVPSQDIEIVLSELSSKGLMMYTPCSSEEEAVETVKMVERLSYKKKYY